MADSSLDTMTSLARALSQPKQDLTKVCGVMPPPTVEGLPCRPCDEVRVFVINTGGTIGMVIHDDVLAPKANALVQSLRKLPILHDEMYAQQTCLYDYYGQNNTLVLPTGSEQFIQTSYFTGAVLLVALGAVCFGGLISFLPIRPNVVLLDQKCMAMWPLATGENKRDGCYFV